MKRIKWIDGMKGCAALGVFSHHFLLAFLESTYSGDGAEAHINASLEYSYAQSPISVITNGNFMVCVFLLLSGILMYMQVRNIQDSKKIIERIVKRYLSLAIPILFMCFVVWAMINLNMFDNSAVTKITQSSWLEQYYNQKDISIFKVLTAGLFSILFCGDSTFSTAFWMLNILFLGSFVSIAEGILSWKYKKKAVLFFIIVAAILLLSGNAYYSLFAFSGVVVEVSEMLCCKNIKVISAIGAIFVICGLILGGYPTGVVATNFYKYFFGGYRIIHIVGAICLVFGFFFSSHIARVFEGKGICSLGKYSLWIYLIHIPIIFSFSTKIFYKTYIQSESYGIAIIGAYIITIFVVMGMSYVLERTLGKTVQRVIENVLQLMEK